MIRLLQKLALSAVLAGIAIVAFTGTANASRSLSVNPGGTFRGISLGLVSLRTTFVGTPVDVTCSVTLNGTIARSIPKVSGTLFGAITSTNIGPGSPNGTCNPTFGQGTSATTSGFPWLLAYLTFTGRLPNPTLIVFHVTGVTFNLVIGGGITPATGCTFRGDIPAHILFAVVGSANVSGLAHIMRHRLPMVSGISPDCPVTAGGELNALFGITPRQTLILVN